MRITLGLLLVCCCCASAAGAASNWTEPLSRMPLRPAVRSLERTNCVAVMLASFEADPVVKALIFLPGATDELHMFRRARADLSADAPTLLDAVCALTNQTHIRASFRPPFLLLHNEEDPLETLIRIEHPPTEARLRKAPFRPHVLYNDKDWDGLQPVFRKALKVDLRPRQYSYDSWHFYRHCFSAWNLTGWEALEVAALAGKSKFTIRRNRADFEPDPRYLAVPRLDHFPR
jgi:hypothetical protein